MDRRSLTVVLLLAACAGKSEEDGPKLPTPAELVASWNEAAAPKWTAWQRAEWEAHVHVRENDATWAEKAAEARVAWEAEVGKADWLTSARDVLTAVSEHDGKKKKDGDDEGPPPPSEAEKRAVESIRMLSRTHTEASAEVRLRRDRELGQQLRMRDRSLPKLDGLPVPPQELEGRYRAATTLEERAHLWSAVLSGARDLKSGFGAQRDALNLASSKLGWEDHHAEVISPYEMKPDEVAAVLRNAEVALRPLYRQLHTWVRYELAMRFSVVEVPEMLPAHWLDEPLGTTWNATFRIQGVDPAMGLAQAGADGLLRHAESFFTEAGLETLPGAVWQASSLYPFDPADRYQKTPGASVWDIDLDGDIRVLMSVTPIEPWLHAAHRELAFAHVLAERERSDWPKPLRAAPLGAMEGALATWSDLAASRPRRLARLGLLDSAQIPEETLMLLEDALTWVPHVVFAAGTAATFEREVYEDKLPVDQLTARWWSLVQEHQGIVPPETRTERWADPLYVQQFTDSPGRYFEFALAPMIAFQLHEKACADSGVDPRYGDLSGAVVGDMFRRVAVGGAEREWRKVVEEVTGTPVGAEAMVRHFEPLMAWLQEQNLSRNVTMAKL